MNIYVNLIIQIKPMATVKFKLRTEQTEQATIYSYLTVKRGKQYLTSTGLTISPKDWKSESKSLTGFPKNIGNPHIKNLRASLTKLESHLLNEVNRANTIGSVINSDWVKSQILICFDRVTSETEKEQVEQAEQNKITVQIQNYINDAPTYVHKSGKVGLSKVRIKTLKNFKRIIQEFEKFTNSTLLLKELDFDFEKRFNKWILETKGFSKNYGGSIIRDIKAIGKYSRKKNIEVNPHIEFIHKYKQQKIDKIIHTFSLQELEKIENWKTNIERLNNARNWLIIGCNVGQRVEDLLNITSKNFVTIKDKTYIQLTQEKTSKDVIIPITKQCQRVLDKGIPHRISQQKLNVYIKEVCELGKINQIVAGDLYNKQTKRKERGDFPKYKLMTTHSFRRSFASNYYIDIPTPVIMEITGHAKESTFLEYINKPVDKTRNANLMLELIELSEKKKVSKKETQIIEMKTTKK